MVLFFMSVKAYKLTGCDNNLLFSFSTCKLSQGFYLILDMKNRISCKPGKWSSSVSFARQRLIKKKKIEYVQ